jgi:hypothetical protein
MPVAPFVPLIAQGVGALVGGRAAKKAQANAMQRTPEEQAALTGATKSASAATDAATTAIGESRPYLRQAGQYYSGLLGGNRAAMAQAVAPARAALGDTYRGATRALEQSGVRGAARTVRQGELNRQRASQVAGLTTGVQPAAAAQLGQLGTAGMQSAAPLLSSAGNIYGNMPGEGFRNRVYGRGEGERAGAAIGDIIRTGGEAFGNWYAGRGPGATSSGGGGGSGAGEFGSEDWFNH